MPSRVTVRNRGQKVNLRAWVSRRSSKKLREAGAFDRKNLESDLLVKVGVVHRRHMSKLYATEGASGGKPWEELDPDYAKQKRKRYPGRKTLVADGTMREDSTSERGEAYVQTIERRGRNLHILLGSDNFLARVHTNEGVRRRTDKRPTSGRGGGRRRPMRSRKKASSRKAPTFTGSYRFVKRSVIQRTRKQVGELRDVLLDYMDRRAVQVLRQGFAASDSNVGSLKIGPVLGG